MPKPLHLRPLLLCSNTKIKQKNNNQKEEEMRKQQRRHHTTAIITKNYHTSP
jgi:hypothetical protein